MSEPLKISVHVEEKRYQPTQEKTVVPGWDAKTVTPDKGYALSKVTVDGMPEPTESETFTENGEYNVGRIGTAIVDVDVDLQDKTVTPTEQTQTVEADTGYDGLDAVTVNPIPPEYVVPTGSVEITQNGPVNVAGKATANVNVPGIIPTGTKQISITANGTTTEDVSGYADAEITVNTDPEKGLVFENYDLDGYPHSARFVGTWTEIGDRWFGSYFQKVANTNTFNRYFYKITSLVIPEGVISIGSYAFENCSSLTNVTFPVSLNELKGGAFAGSMIQISNFYFPGNIKFGFSCFDRVPMQSVVCGAQCVSIGNSCFYGTNNLELADFSHCTYIPPLYSTYSFQHKSGCVIRIPSALSNTTLGEGNGWESATNWSALTNIVWEVV